MTTFWSCHLIVNSQLSHDRRRVLDFIDADFCHWEGTSSLFLRWIPSKNANMFFSLLRSFWENVKYFYC